MRVQSENLRINEVLLRFKKVLTLRPYSRIGTTRILRIFNTGQKREAFKKLLLQLLGAFTLDLVEKFKSKSIRAKWWKKSAPHLHTFQESEEQVSTPKINL